MTSQREGQLRRLAESYTAAWCSQNASRVAGFYSLDSSLRVNAGPTAVGRDAIAGVAQGFMAAFPDLNVIMDDIVVGGFEEWRIGADGLIAESRGHFDSAEYQRQLEQGVNGAP